MSKLYRVWRVSPGARCVVVEGGEPRDLDPRYDLVRHSPTGYGMAYGGSGPSQLALAICADALGDDRRAVAVYQEFKWRVVALERDRFEISAEEVRAIADSIERVAS